MIRGRDLRCSLSIGPDSRMEVWLDDPYWSRLVSASYDYEPELRHVLRRLRGTTFDVVDCGANFGYWSILLSGPELGSHDVVAVEPTRSTFEALASNSAINAGRFRCVQLAITSSTGQTVRIDASEDHAGAHVAASPAPATNADDAGETVATTSLDDLVDTYAAGPDRRLLIKLDVEGQEVNAFVGAKRTLHDRDVLFLYEDFGADLESRVTRLVLHELELRVFFGHPDGELVEIRDAAEASRFKKRANVGYNFVACRADSEFLTDLGIR